MAAAGSVRSLCLHILYVVAERKCVGVHPRVRSLGTEANGIFHWAVAQIPDESAERL